MEKPNPLSPNFSKEIGRPPVAFKCGTLLVKENETSRKMFIICSGKARVFKQYLDRKVTLAILGEGELFGELSFFDAEPRSASVEALTDLKAIVIDGNEAAQQIAGLPSWVLPIFRTAFRRFRLADQRIAVLESMNEYRKKTYREDGVGKVLHLELMRFLKGLELLHTRAATKPGANGKVNSQNLQQELDHMLGSRTISLRAFWRVLKENDFIDNKADEQEGLVQLNQPAIADFEAFLAKEVETGRYLILGHPALAILRKIISFAQLGPDGMKGNQDIPATIPLADLNADSIPLSAEGFAELERHGVLQKSNASVLFTPRALFRMFTFQSIVKVFDHTVANID